MITSHTQLIVHIGYPTTTFKSPMIYNPYFQKKGIDAVVVPMGRKAENVSAFLPSLFQLANIRGALITMPLKVKAPELVDETSVTVKIAGACNAIGLGPHGRLAGDMFDREVAPKAETTAFLAAARARLRDPGRRRYAVRADSRLSRFLRPAGRHRRRTPRGRGISYG
jgi:shikimate 5-dehydrogenase